MNGECDGAETPAPVIVQFTIEDERADGTLILRSAHARAEGKVFWGEGRPTTFTLTVEGCSSVVYRVLQVYADGSMLLLGPYDDCYYMRAHAANLCMLALDQLVRDAWIATHVRGER